MGEGPDVWRGEVITLLAAILMLTTRVRFEEAMKHYAIVYAFNTYCHDGLKERWVKEQAWGELQQRWREYDMVGR